MFGNFLQTRRATRALADAMRRGSLEDMRYAIEQGANLTKVSDTFDEPGQHFRMSYGVKGALELAVEHRLPLEAFQLLLRAGAPVPTKFGDRPHAEALFSPDELANWSQTKAVIDLVHQHCSGGPEASTPPASRRPGV